MRTAPIPTPTATAQSRAISYVDPGPKTSASRRSVGVDAALDFGEAFLVAEDHCGDGDCASYNNPYDRNQQRAAGKIPQKREVSKMNFNGQTLI